MHPMFQVSIDFYDHSSPNYVWQNPSSHIVVLAKLKLQLMPGRSCRVEIAGVLELRRGKQNCLLLTILTTMLKETSILLASPNLIKDDESSIVTN